jgi:acyl transferase domain-containing protein/NAD(P)H-dependent flavin oxidoreductase YrpB (nitropropane dioxygenase family)/NADP-dependent 3-hydroxy acid dehydrogenase YdfG
MFEFTKFVFTPAGCADAALAIAACRAGGVGILNGELASDPAPLVEALDSLAKNACAPYGLKLDAVSDALAAAVRAHAKQGMKWLILDAEILTACEALIGDVRNAGVRVLAEVKCADGSETALNLWADGLMIKGNEAGGFVGEDSSFILLQKWRQRTALPLYVRGGITPHVAAACATIGVAGGVLDSQLLLMDEVRLPDALRTLLGNLSGSETIAVGHGEAGEYFRLLVRPSLAAARKFATAGYGLRYDELRQHVSGRAMWQSPTDALLPIGQDVVFAAAWRKRFGSVAAVLRAIDLAIEGHARIALQHRSIGADAPLAQAMGVRFPIIQGPMTRVSDTAEFALAVAEAGALPMVAFAVMKGQPLEELLRRTAQVLDKRPWGIGLLGFAPQALLDEQLTIAARFAPDYAIIAGGRPDQAVQLEQAGVPTFLHVPSANLIPTFLQEGARRFIFEGRECGGHIGPLSSFVLWSSIVDRVLTELAPCKVRGEELELVFAGGIHDDVSSAMLQVMTAPLAAVGAKVGILMGSAYLFTKEIVSSGSIVGQFQQEVLDCERTVNLESGVGHASRCAYTPFARDFFRRRSEMLRSGIPADEGRRLLDELILGRLRTASKGRKRDGANGIQTLDPTQQHEEGMYMLGQVATLRNRVTDVHALHGEVTVGAATLLTQCLQQPQDSLLPSKRAVPADIAIVGIACVLPKANSTGEYWENILAKVDAITEIPTHRWDWRLYFDADRNTKDKIYSKWGGFLDDLAFDPMKYGMPPKSIESVDPMQLMGLEVAQRTLVDAGYHEKPFDRERASVIIGASGGIGDFGMQYGLRSELPRFSGELPLDLAARLPEWTEDSFAGILPNVAAGRIANRLNFGGMNITTDAACASSLAAIYQGVSELTAGRSDFVIAGGLDTVQGPFGYLCFSKTQALSPRGKCCTFDTGGDGIVISEGIAMVALKRLADAQRDGDRIYGVIKGVGASSDGSAKGMTAPLPAGQLRAMRRAYAMAGFGPSSVGLFEAHGTGTVAGDTAELESTTRLMQEEGALPHQAAIGSVKTMIGHTKATAGAAGLVKAVLALHHRVLPPHSNVTHPNSMLVDPAAPLYLLDEATPWISPGGQPRRAACSAFGFGGTNFHVVLEEYVAEYRDWLRPPASDTWGAELLLWGESDRPALVSRIESFNDAIADLDGLLMRDVAASLAARFSPNGQTLAIVARSSRDLRAKLSAALGYLRGDLKLLPPGVFHGDAVRPAGKVAVLFSGQGSQYPSMVREVALHFDTVSGALSDADRVLGDAFEARFGAASSLTKFIFPRGAYDESAKSDARQRLASTDVAQPALGAVEVGLFRLMRSLGLTADMFAGHSYGEFVALHAAGAIDFEALMQLSAARGRFIVDAARAENAELGTMAAVNAPRKVVEDAIANIDGVILANHNAPLQSVISGTRAAVKAAAAKLAEAGVEVTEIAVAAAFHSSLVEPAQQALSDLIDITPWSPTATPVYSNTTASPHAADPALVKRLMAQHLVRPVEFVAEVEAMYAAGARIFVEVGPKAVLARLVSRILDGRPHAAVSVDDGSGLAGLLGGVAQLLCAGVKLDIAGLFARRDCRVGDPTQPATLRRVELVSKHAWMINGSGARRAAASVRQIGVTLEQARSAVRVEALPAAAAASPTVASALAAPAAAAPSAAQTQQTNVAQKSSASAKHAFRKDGPMDVRRNDSGMAETSVMSEYFETMRQFLETQERVMSAFLGEAGAMRSATRARTLPMNMPRMAELAAAPVVVPVAKQHVAAPAPVPAPKTAEPIAAPQAAAAAPTASKTADESQAPRANGAAGHPTKANGAALTREKLRDMLLGIVEEKTGYPPDMLGLDQNLEADLGIDSIKRVEVVGALLKLLPDGYREALTQSRSKLNTQSTLNGMLDLITQAKVGGAVAVPFDSAGVVVKADVVSQPPRLVMCARREPLAPNMGRRLTPGLFVLTRDALGVADVLAQSLRARGTEVLVVGPDVLAADSSLIEWCRSIDAAAPIAGVVHLAALGSAPLSGREGPAEWRAAIQVTEKSFFLLLRELNARLTQGAHVVAVSDLGGLFGRDGSASGALRLQGGAVGVVKSLFEERDDLRVKAVDLDAGRSASDLASDVLAEIELDGGRQEVGYPAGHRTIFATAAAEVTLDPAREAKLVDLVVLATGGARGITAEVLRELALPGNTLVLTGRSRVPEKEPEDYAQLADADGLRKYFVAQVHAGTLKLTPGEVRRRVQSVLDLREMRANLADFRAAGAAVEYHSVDVTDESAIGALIEDVKRRHGRIDGVVHGAGVIEDKLLVDKQSDSWSRVVETKVIGLMLLQKLVDPAALKFFTVFSSVAGRYGNSGQSDYATANELMNRVCVALQARWGTRVAVSALCWGPWGPTKFGAGMVTPDTEAKFEKRGVFLVSAALGRRLLRQEIARSDGSPVEVICGQGPWESHEAERGVIRPAAADVEAGREAKRPSADAPELGPLLGNAEVHTRPTGEKILHVRLDSARHLYLQEHVFDGKMVLPAAAALELMAEAARTFWPRWCVVAVHELRVLKNIELERGTRDVQLHVSPPPYGSSEGFEVSASLKSDAGAGRLETHFQCVVRMEQSLPAATPAKGALHKDKSLTVAKAYGEWLSHGPRLQVIENIDGLSAGGSGAQVRATRPNEWLSLGNEGSHWVFDPALLVAATQMVSLWARAYRDETVLPARYGRVVRYRDSLPARVHMEFERTDSSDPAMIRGNVVFFDEQNEAVLAIEELECVVSATLNRLGGKARAAERAVA